MPNTKIELGEEFPGDGVTHLEFFCTNCRCSNMLPMEVLEDSLTTARATGMFLVYQERFKAPMFREEDIKAIAEGAKQFLRTKNQLFKRWAKEIKSD